MLLQTLQNLLGGIYDVPLTHRVDEFLLTDRSRLPPELRQQSKWKRKRRA